MSKPAKSFSFKEADIRWFARAVATVVLLLLASCFTSATPLLGAGDTPLPSAFHAVKVDTAGRIEIDKAGKEKLTSFEKVGLSYSQVGGSGPLIVTLRMWDTATHMYAAQFAPASADASKPAKIFFGLATVEDASVAVYAPNPMDAAMPDAMREAGLTSAGGVYAFTTREQLNDGLRVLSHRLGKSLVMRWRIYASPGEDGQLQADIETAKAAGSSVASPGAAPAPPGEPTPAGDPAQALAQVTPITDPARLLQDPGADVPNSCDQQAANPVDPDRMASGVAFESIVPRLAQQECERAVTRFPNTARFKYQRGRAYYAGRNYGPAIADYQQAAAEGYPAAFVGLGTAYAEGNGVAKDGQLAELMFRKALAGGIDTKSDIAEYVFNSDGYSSPQVMQAVFDGRLSSATMKAQSAYWFTFLDLYHNTPDCVRIMSDQTYAKFYMAGQMGTITGMLGALAQAHSGGTSGDFGADAQSGWNAGKQFGDTMIANVSSAKQDAQLFYDRHGCSSQVAYKFANIAAAASSM